MRILELAAEGWRNLEPLRLLPAERLSVLFGDNGQGKTNVLEAAYYLAALRSFRTTHADDLIQRGAPHGRAHLRAEVLHRGLERRFDVELGAGYAAALSWVLFALVFAVTAVQLAVQRRWVIYD